MQEIYQLIRRLIAYRFSLHRDNAKESETVVLVTKIQVLDLLKHLPSVYPHDKAEGLALLPIAKVLATNI